MFRKRKKEKELEERAKRLRREKIKKVIAEVRPKLEMVEHAPKPEKERFYTSDYYQFLKEIKKEPRTFFEKLCWKAERVLKVKLDKKTREKMESEIRTAYLNVSAEGVVALTFLVFLFGIISLIPLIIFVQDPLFSFLYLLLIVGAAWYVFTYPSRASRAMEVKMASDLVLAILYMVIYMRTSPNLEGALRFTADNLKGPLSWDLKKLLWDMEAGVYPSLDVALATYLAKWRDKNEEFVEAMQMLRAATGEVRERRLALLDEAVNVMLNGTRDKMKHYAQALQLPVMLVYAMGIMLPVIGLVMFPIVAIFMSDLVRPAFIFVGYDVLLPTFLLWYMSNILRTRPATFSQPEVSEIKDLPPLGKFRIGRNRLPVVIPAVLVALPFLLVSFWGIGSTPPSQVSAQVVYSVLAIFGIGMGIGVACFLDAFQKLPVRNDIEKIEEEFGEALFQLGNQVASGRPIETAVDYAIKNMRNLKIADFFREVSVNMKKLGLTFSQAIFDEEVGAIKRYPSRLIRSVCKVIIESAGKSVKLTALTMLTLARYLKGVKMVKEEIRNLLGGTLVSMKFLATFLMPLTAGVTVTMAMVIIQILFQLSMQLSELSAYAPEMGLTGLVLWGWSAGGEGIPITPAGFQLIVGIYLIETATLLAYFINRIEYGEDAIGLRAEIANILIVAIVVYLFSWFVTYLTFAPVIQEIMLPVR